MDNQRFTRLLQLYLDEEATPAEIEELMKLINEGEYDEDMKGQINNLLHNDDFIGEEMDHDKARMMFAEITSGNNASAADRRLMNKWRWMAAAAVLVMGVCSAVWFLKTDTAPPQMIASREEMPEPAVFKGEQLVRLPDGSIVLLKEDSELSYSSSFGSRTREVTLVGEGYFDVHHDPDRPFKVLTGKVTTTVLGTSFTIKAYPGQKEIRVTVTRGKVQVGDADRTFAVITPDQELAVNTTTHDFVRQEVKAEIPAILRNQYFRFDNTSLEEAAQILAEKYKVNILLANDKLRHCRISATFLSGEDLDQVMTVMTGVVRATYEKLPNGDISINGKGCE